MHNKLLIATQNPGKRAEIEVLLANVDVTLISPQDLGLELDVVEDGQTYAENALLKAQAFSAASGMLSLADDSGLETAALDGAPGIHSARFSPKPGASDADRRSLLLETLKTHPRPWAARFHCVVALAAAGIEALLFEGSCPGEIIPDERGQNGFGYDPIFLLSESGKTMAQLSMHEKNLLSHRARAITAAIPAITRLLKLK